MQLKLNSLLLKSLVLTALVSNLPAYAADAETIYRQVCASCHGTNGEGNDGLNSPALAGQQASYLARQLENYSTGIRGAHKDDSVGRQMAAMANTVAAADRLSMGVFLSSLPAGSNSPSAGDAKNGYKYYQSCGSCHGDSAQGNEALNAPRLAGLSAAYLLRQHKNFNLGLRGTHADDRFGRQMKMMAGTMTDEVILKDIVAYITSIEP